MKVAIADTLGLCYDGDTLNRRGLGGSESAVICMARELAAIGFEVHVYNDCASDDCAPGLYSGVLYKDIKMQPVVEEPYDVVIGMRSVAIFTDRSIHNQFKTFTGVIPVFPNGKYKVLWMHDTFCDGDQYIEPMVVQGYIDEIFTLSDFHTDYVTNCDHGNRRNFEVLKKHVFQTRNGINQYQDWIDVRQKDPNSFVYNSSVTKGLVPLLDRVWPTVKNAIPNAHLTVIGGYYRFRSNHNPDEQEIALREMIRQYEHRSDVTFTDIITQKEISDILTKASYMIYPAAFPETFGISALESLAHNVPILTCEFGALEETAIDLACYKINYAIEPNSLFQNINKTEQVDKFVNMVVNAYRTPYLHQQKMYACNQVKDICDWSTVALQWKQHFYAKAGKFMPVEEYRRVSEINYKVKKVFGRRFGNIEELQTPKKPEKRILVITPVYNAEKYIERCIDSVAAQDYDNWQMVVIDDRSDDDTHDVITNTMAKYPFREGRFKQIINVQNNGAVFNQHYAIHKYAMEGDIIMLLDGDDWLVNDPNIFHRYNNMYHDGAHFTYGSCWSLADSIPLIAQPYPPEVIKEGKFRDYKFNWNMPYTHLRTFTAKYFLDLPEKTFHQHNGEWLRAGGDTSVFYGVLESVPPESIRCVSDIVYNYNDQNPLNDYKVNGKEQNETATKVMEGELMPKKILIAIPTARNIEAITFKSIYDLEIPPGYEATFQYFYGYNVDQVRNLIADWTVRGFDYLFAVDYDISFAPDTLKKLLSHDKPLVSGLYRQRLEPEVLELYTKDGQRPQYKDIHDKPLIEIGGCGFGCVLVKTEVFKTVGYPQFVYHHALDHRNTFSEDMDFCKKAVDKGFKLYADPSVVCKHWGQSVFEIGPAPEKKSPEIDHVLERFEELRAQKLLPQDHVNMLKKLKEEGFAPRIIFDLGSCVMHWADVAHEVWPHADIGCVDAMGGDSLFKMYASSPYRFLLGRAVTSKDRDYIDFYCNEYHPGGNSLYKENPELSPLAAELFPEESKQRAVTITLDSIAKTFGSPDLIKMDIQGSELEALRGGHNVLRHCKYVILELQHTNYNMGAPQREEVIEYMDGIGYDCLGQFCGSSLGVDGDYLFKNRLEGSAI